MLYCSELNKEFKTRKDMITALKINKDMIMDEKKSIIRKSQGVSLIIKSDGVAKEDDIPKILAIGDDVKVAMNTVNYFDFDKDVLLNDSWNKSANDQNGKTYHIVNHELKIGSIIAYPKDVQVLVENHKWSDLGKSFDGETQVLIFVSKMTDKTNKDAFLAYKDNEPVEHSIRLRYIKMAFAFKSDEPEDKKENALYMEHYPSIANKEEVDKFEYFWAVLEAKIHKEGSMVLFGANDATPQLGNKTEPLKGTHVIIEPLKDTQTSKTILNILKS